MIDTIFALSSGAPPAGISVIRLSGPQAEAALKTMAGSIPEARRASLRTLRDIDGLVLDQALVLWLPGPQTATGEDMAELHCHGGRAVVAAVEGALGRFAELRRATPGEFTQRAFINGRIDLAEAEGLADLLEAETELQRKSALAMAGGAVSRQVGIWRERVLALSAAVEAVLDFSDEEDVSQELGGIGIAAVNLGKDIASWLERPRAEQLKEGYKVALAGPPNAGKSSLFNVLVEGKAAIVTAVAGTTRDVLTRPVALSGMPFVFADTAGLRDETDDPVESIGIARARDAIAWADLVLWLGEEGSGPPCCWEISPQCDRADLRLKRKPRHVVSSLTGQGIDALRADLVDHARNALSPSGMTAINQRQHALLFAAWQNLAEVEGESEYLLVAERLRLVRQSFDRLTGRATTDDMLDALFGRFCIGK